MRSWRGCRQGTPRGQSFVFIRVSATPALSPSGRGEALLLPPTPSWGPNRVQQGSPEVPTGCNKAPQTTSDTDSYWGPSQSFARDSEEHCAAIEDQVQGHAVATSQCGPAEGKKPKGYVRWSTFKREPLWKEGWPPGRGVFTAALLEGMSHFPLQGELPLSGFACAARRH